VIDDEHTHPGEKMRERSRSPAGAGNEIIDTPDSSARLPSFRLRALRVML
jgi:hypothetical protein